jgi:drug/metabolite transporter (DMT)-like permease
LQGQAVFVAVIPSLRSRWPAEVALLLAVVIWGLNVPLLKSALAVLHPHVVNALRMALSTLVLGGFYYREQRRHPEGFWAPMRQQGQAIFGLGMLGYVLYMYLFVSGLHGTHAGTAALIMASSPFWTAVFSHLFRIERLRRQAWLGLAVLLAGAMVVAVAGSGVVGFDRTTLSGNLLMLGSAMAWGASTTLSRPVVRRISPMGLTFFCALVGLPFLLLLALPRLPAVDWAQVTTGVWLILLYSGSLSTGVAVALWNVGIRHTGTARTAAWGNLVPFVALVCSVLLLDEPITAIQVLGGVLILTGLSVIRRTPVAV